MSAATTTPILLQHRSASTLAAEEARSNELRLSVAIWISARGRWRLNECSRLVTASIWFG